MKLIVLAAALALTSCTLTVTPDGSKSATLSGQAVIDFLSRK